MNTKMSFQITQQGQFTTAYPSHLYQRNKKDIVVFQSYKVIISADFFLVSPELICNL